MKKFLLGFILMAGIGASCYAQNISLGPTAGFGHSWIDNLDGSRYHPAGNVGIGLVYSNESNFGFGADVKFSIEGTKTETTLATTTINLDYIRVPLKLMYFFGKYGDKVRPKITVGPSFGFLIGGNRKLEIGTATLKTDANDLYNTVDIGVNGSFGINYRLIKNTWFFTDINYYHGISDIVKNNSSSINYKNRNIGLNIGVNFGLGQ
jgi:phage anti-repressor protein